MSEENGMKLRGAYVGYHGYIHGYTDQKSFNRHFLPDPSPCLTIATSIVTIQDLLTTKTSFDRKEWASTSNLIQDNSYLTTVTRLANLGYRGMPETEASGFTYFSYRKGDVIHYN